MSQSEKTFYHLCVEYAREELDGKIQFSQYEAYIQLIAKYLSDPESLLRFGICLEIIAHELAEEAEISVLSRAYSLASALAIVTAQSNGLNLRTCVQDNWNSDLLIVEYESMPRTVLTTYEAAYYSFVVREIRRETTALVHGHFRLLTFSNLAFLINAENLAQNLFVGIESQSRTEQHKGKSNLLTDAARFRIFGTLFPNTFMIGNEYPYSNLGYALLVQLINPNIYVGQSDNPAHSKQAMRMRASNIGSRYVEVLNAPGPSTSLLHDFTKQVTKK